MLLDVRSFRRRVKSDMRRLVGDLQEATGRFGVDEELAWESSLPRLSKAFDAAGLERFHIQFGHEAAIDLEYQMPAAASYCDAVLLGRGEAGPVAVMFELKHWDTSSDRPGPRASLVDRPHGLMLHPSAQVEGYVEYCRRFHEAVVGTDAAVEGCVLFTKTQDAWAYVASPHSALVGEFPVFTMSDAAATGSLTTYLRMHLHRPDGDFAERFSRGGYKQDRNFVAQVAQTIRDGTPEFVLLDNQRLGFELCVQRVDEALAGARGSEKAVILIEGPPGSGKSVVAAHLWAELANRPELQGDCVVVSTSGAQAANWEHLFTSVAGKRAGAGFVVRANRLNPGLTPKWVGEARKRGLAIEVETWRANLDEFHVQGHVPRLKDDTFTVTIVDEAHALIDPAAHGARGVSPSGWGMHAGPQAWHVMRTSRVSIFLTDPRQSYRDNELTTPERIRELAKDQGISRVEEVSLGDAQFRCGGSAEYVKWVDTVLRDVPAAEVPAPTWRRTATRPGRFGFEIVDTPQALEDALRREADLGRRVRLVASYARPWRTKDEGRPHDLLAHDMDFHIPYAGPDGERHWSRIWNHAPGQDYARWVQAPKGTPMAEDPLAEVGCPYVVRGFDFDVIGLLWLEDLVWRGNAWQADLGHVHESAWRMTKGRAKKGDPAAADELLRRLKRGYRILLSRAVRGIYLWVADEETRERMVRAAHVPLGGDAGRT
ncbi:MAG: DNA/RNA helicase domain-containing protein [Planctomycetota bacterium]